MELSVFILKIMNINLNINAQQNSRINTPFFPNKAQKKSKPISFGIGGQLLTLGLQACEQHPMIGVSVIDAATCIIPRAAVDFHTNMHAGLETLRRESSGLLVNCILPSYFVMGIAGFLKYLSLPKEYRHLGLASSWADETSILKLASHYKNSTKNVENNSKVYAYVKSVLSDMEGFNSSKGGWVGYANDKTILDNAVSKLTSAIKGETKVKDAISSAYRLLADASNATETIRFIQDDGAEFGSNLKAVLRDIVDMGKKFNDPAVSKNIDAFSATAIKFVKQKSFASLALILPLAASMQYINRWITRKKSGIKGAPIYRDFGSENKSQKEQPQKLLSHKIAGVAAMMGLAIASMMKKPSLKMFQFKGLFPTLDQARWIAAITFSSRILAAEDCNEVRESTIRDMAGFASLYFLGDYVAKSFASLMHKVNPRIDLINKHKDVGANANIFRKFGNWMKNHSLKSFDEVPKEFKNYRSICQATSLGASMLLLGLFIPIWSRKQTEKNRAKELENQVSLVKNIERNPLELGPESTVSMLWHKWTSENSAFGRFEKMANFK